jgi:hypothetical protein
MTVYVVSSCDRVYDRVRGVVAVFQYLIEADVYTRKMNEEGTNDYFILKK